MSDFTDRNADQVHQFALEMGNLGLSRVADLVVSMLESGVWRDFKDGTARYQFLPGEFDYFLSQQGVTRELLVNGIRDVSIKARLEEAMDERRTGDAEYRRPVLQARSELPERPGRPVAPFGCTKSEAKSMGGDARAREALGRAPRQYRLTDGATTKRPNELRSRVERLTASVLRLADDELEQLQGSILEELARRRK